MKSFDGTTETPVGATYNFGSVASGGSGDVRFRARNTGASAVVIDTLTLSGAGFSIAAVNGTDRRARLARSRLYLILEARPHGDDPSALLDAALQGGVDVVQLREKE